MIKNIKCICLDCGYRGDGTDHDMEKCKEIIETVDKYRKIKVQLGYQAAIMEFDRLHPSKN